MRLAATVNGWNLLVTDATDHCSAGPGGLKARAVRAEGDLDTHGYAMKAHEVRRLGGQLIAADALFEALKQQAACDFRSPLRFERS